MIIAGPCAAETESQVLETARALSALSPCIKGGLVFRAGLWKPRTNPDTFQGVGEAGLAWLRRVKAETGLPTATEVATPEHIRLALAAGVDCLWLGARTTANPILVQALADALAQARGEGLTCTVLVKNPVNEDAELWLGDIERIERTGCSVMAVHRGCGHRPCWNMPHLLRARRPDIPLLLDPSHMGGAAERVAQLGLKGIALGFDGAMIEVHPQPETALSDKRQQITPQALAQIIGSLPQAKPANGLDFLRAELDEIDDRIWELITRRMDISAEIGIWKKQNDMQPLQPARYEQMVADRVAWGKAQGIAEETIRGIYEHIHAESLRRQ